ncbi:hypothetical protein CRENBAI_013482 [Crenichthys baileyi]|uniref:Uncharacterized protein n=1 Tax=Crenichthys baileyi TaxID=28760 RepID=A0AAV9SLC7_9TELE
MWQRVGRGGKQRRETQSFERGTGKRGNPGNTEGEKKDYQMVCDGSQGEGEWSMRLLTAASVVNGCLFHSVDKIQRVMKTAVVLGEQEVQKTRLKMDRLVSGTEASRGNVIQVTTEVLVMVECNEADCTCKEVQQEVTHPAQQPTTGSPLVENL